MKNPTDFSKPTDRHDSARSHETSFATTTTNTHRQQQQQQRQIHQQGILRMEAHHQSRSYRAASSPRLMPTQVEPSSPQPSVDRLSVTFALAERSCSSDGHEATSPPPGSSPPLMPLPSLLAQSSSAGPSPKFDFNHQSRKRVQTLDSALVYAKPMEIMAHHRLSSIGVDSEEAFDEDYSLSASAIIQRRNSTRRHSRRKRRPSSPFSPEAVADNGLICRRRRSSVFTTSSGDTAISMTEAEPIDDQISKNLNIHKDVLNGAKSQPWQLRKKLRLIRQAKSYIRRHEGELQERLAQTRSTRDYVARTKLLLAKKWQYVKRELINIKTVLVPWESTIKHIESQFGSAVASYFIFLRWLFWFNFAISFMLVAFVAIPEILATMRKTTISGERKLMLTDEWERGAHPRSLWEFEGFIKYSPFFYGWYSDKYLRSNYNRPLTYFVVQLVVYTYSFVAILRKMAANSRMSKLSEKEDECAFSWKLFSSWDFMIGNAETAENRIGNIVLGFKEALVEESEKQRDARNWKITTIRAIVNVVVFLMLLVSAYVVVEIVDRSENSREIDLNWLSQNQVSIVLGLITYVFPIAFEILGMIERYHPRKQLRFQLFRIMILNLLNMYSLIYALFKKINSSEVELQSLKPASPTSSVIKCYNKLVPCEPNVLATTAIAAMSLVLNPNVPIAARSPIITGATSPPELELRHLPTALNNEASSIFTDDDNDSSSIGSLQNVNDIIGITSRVDDDEESTDDPVNFTAYPDLSSSNDGNDNDSATKYRIDNDSTSTDNDLIKISTTVTDNDLRAIDDNYPHVSYDYGILDVNNGTVIEYDDDDDDDRGTSSLSTTIFVNDVTDEPQTVVPIRIQDTAVASTTTVTTTTTKQQQQQQEKWTGCGDEGTIKCYERVCANVTVSSGNYSAVTLNITTRRKLKSLCWETMFGQELAKVTVVDLVLTLISVLTIDFARALVVRYFNDFWCWDLEKQFPQYGEFKIAENILHLVNNQGMVWMGIFFSPGLIVLNLVKLVILMHLRSWTVVTCNVPHEIVFRASRSNNFYLSLLLTMLFLCVLPVGYAITWVEPSWHCGPFSGYKRIYHLATKSLRDALPTYVLEYRILDYIASPGIVIPLIVLMTLVIYYMVSLTNLLRESNNDLKIQLRKERTEERRKMFKIAEQRLESNNDKNKQAYSKWENLVPQLNSIKKAEDSNDNQKARSADNSDNGENTDGEQESLPNDQPPESSSDKKKSTPYDGDEKKILATTAADRKNTWLKRASRTREGCEIDDDNALTGETAAIPRIHISGEDDDAVVVAESRDSKM